MTIFPTNSTITRYDPTHKLLSMTSGAFNVNVDFLSNTKSQMSTNYIAMEAPMEAYWTVHVAVLGHDTLA